MIRRLLQDQIIAAYEKGSVWNYGSRKSTGKLNPEEKALVRLSNKETIAEVVG